MWETLSDRFYESGYKTIRIIKTFETNNRLKH